MLNDGDKVRNPKCPEWGVGKILSVRDGDKVDVFFVDAGKKVLATQIVTLEVVEDAPSNWILDSPNFYERGISDGEYRDLTSAKENFLAAFPKGFEDPTYLKEERDSRIEASELLKETLSKPILQGLIAQGDYADVCKLALAVVAKTNLISSPEKTLLTNRIKTNPDSFAKGLLAFLYGDDELETRFGEFAICLEETVPGKKSASTWTNTTFFLHLAYPDEQVFFKPTVTQKVSDLIRAELNYKKEPNWRTYRFLQEMVNYLKVQLNEMGMAPRDMIDVQSFMWKIQPDKR